MRVSSSTCSCMSAVDPWSHVHIAFVMHAFIVRSKFNFSLPTATSNSKLKTPWQAERDYGREDTTLLLVSLMTLSPAF